MLYMLLIYSSESDWTDRERSECIVESVGVGERLAAQGKYHASSPLGPIASAVTVRVRQGETLITDGPFAETSEQLGGFYILDLEDLDEAIAVASRLPPAKKGTVEIRPIFPIDGLPPTRPIPTPFDDRLDIFLCYDPTTAWDQPEVLREGMKEAVALTHELNRGGRYLAASPLRPTETATCVRIRDGKRWVTDGPFAETQEFLGGYYLVRSSSLEEALAAAARHPGARSGAVEVRPLVDLAPWKKTR